MRPDAPDTKALVDETSALEVQVRDLEARLDAADTRHATFVRPRPLGLDAFRRSSTRTRCCWSTRSAMRAAICGSCRAERFGGSRWRHAPRIEALARRVHKNSRVRPEASDAAHRKGFEEDQRALPRLVIEPAASLLAGKRLVVVLTGALSLVPFGALPQPRRLVTPGPPDLAPMLMRHEIVQVPSATMLGAMRLLTAGRAPPTKTAAIFADPIFEAQDPRVRPTGSSARPTRAHTASAPNLSLARLPFSRGEADAIARWPPKR